jgi:hypothetical protein
MSNNLSLAQRYAYNLARTLMACVTLFHGEMGYGVVLSSEFDGDPALIVHEYDPFA